jgi:hypothetical protein
MSSLIGNHDHSCYVVLHRNRRMLNNPNNNHYSYLIILPDFGVSKSAYFSYLSPDFLGVSSNLLSSSFWGETGMNWA